LAESSGRFISNSNFVDSLYRYCLPLCLSMTLSANTAIELLPQLVASVLSAHTLSILKPLLQNRLFSQGIVVAGSVKVDDIPVTWILKDWTSPVKGLFLDCRKFQMAKAAGRISDFGTIPSPDHSNEPLSRNASATNSIRRTILSPSIFSSGLCSFLLLDTKLPTPLPSLLCFRTAKSEISRV
jgi:hypothetical protein